MIRRRKRLPIIVPVASMGDIAFLLIIFFMLTSNFMRNRAIELEQPKSPDVENLKATLVTVSLDRDSVLRLQGEICDVGILESGVGALINDMEDKRVELKIDKNITQKEYIKVLMALSRADAKVVLVGEQSMD